MRKLISEHRLLDQVLRGDSDAITTLVKEHTKLAYSVAFRVLYNKEDAEEIVHDAFIKAFDALPTFNRAARFSTWLYQIVQRLALNRLKGRKVDFSDDTTSSDIADDDWDKLEEEDRRYYVELALRELDITERLIVTMHYFSQLSISEIGSILEMSKSAVKMRLLRSRTVLREKIEYLLNDEIKNLY